MFSSGKSVAVRLVQAVTTPAQAISAIMLEAYKKYILVSLLLHGKVCLSNLLSYRKCMSLSLSQCVIYLSM